MKKLVIIETSDIGARYTGEAARRLGFDPVFLVCLANYQGDTLAQIKEFEHYDLNTTSIETMQNFIAAQEWGIAAITTFLDSRLHFAIALAEHFKVRGLDVRLLPFKDKGRVYELAPFLSPPSVCFNRRNIPREEIESLRQQCSQVILKPRCTAGGIGARKFSSAEPVENLVNHISSSEIPVHLQPEEWMAQGFISGELVSAEGFVHNGETRILGLSGRRKIGNTESWVGFPYDQHLSEQARSEAMNKVIALMDASEVENAFFHIELIVTGTNAYVIDANLGRMGGGGIGEIFASAFEVSPVEIFAEVLKLSLFPEMEVSSLWNKAPAFAVSVAYGLAQEGRLVAVGSESSERIFLTQILAEGSQVPAMGSDNWAWVGIVSGPSADVADCLRKMTLNSSNGFQSACYAMAEC